MTDRHVTLFEMGARDGLQNEPTPISTEAKIQLVDMLSECGLEKIEVTSFVSPKWVPQMADADQVLAGISRKPGLAYTALTPNLVGFERALAAGVDEVAVFASASEGFSRKNINCTIAESIERFSPVLRSARTVAIPVRGYVSCVTDCPYDGPVPPEQVARVCKQLLEMGCYEVSLGDTIGGANPQKTERLLSAVLSIASADRFAGHFHDTHGLALANIEVCLSMGLRTFDASVGGLGGCPYAPGAKGNVATEAVLSMLKKKGFQTGVDLAQILKVGAHAKGLRSPQ